MRRQREPRPGDRQEQGRARHPGQARHLPPAPRDADPDEQHGARQHHPDQPLGQQAQRAGHETRPRPAGVRRVSVFCVGGGGRHQKGQGKAPDGRGDPRGHQHVVVDVLAAQQKRRAGGQHPGGGSGQPFARQAPRGRVQPAQHEARRQCRHQAPRPSRWAQQRHGGRLQPVQQRGLVEEGQPVQARHQPVARQEHPAADLAVAPLVRQRQRANGGQQDQPQPARKQGLPRAQAPAGAGGPARALRRRGQ